MPPWDRAEYDRNYYRSNREWINARKRDWRKRPQVKAKLAAADKRRYLANRDRLLPIMRERAKRWYHNVYKHTAKFALRQAAIRAMPRTDEMRAKHAAYVRRWREALKHRA